MVGKIGKRLRQRFPVHRWAASCAVQQILRGKRIKHRLSLPSADWGDTKLRPANKLDKDATVSQHDDRAKARVVAVAKDQLDPVRSHWLDFHPVKTGIRMSGFGAGHQIIKNLFRDILAFNTQSDAPDVRFMRNVRRDYLKRIGLIPINCARGVLPRC